VLSSLLCPPFPFGWIRLLSLLLSQYFSALSPISYVLLSVALLLSPQCHFSSLSALSPGFPPPPLLVRFLLWLL
jgi:hypothetical protein